MFKNVIHKNRFFIIRMNHIKTKLGYEINHIPIITKFKTIVKSKAKPKAYLLLPLTKLMQNFPGIGFILLLQRVYLIN